MTKSLMISIQPQHAVNILNGKKTLELRTWIPKGYVGWVYVYVTKGVGKSKYHHLYNLTEYNNGKTFFSITHHNKHSLVPDGFLNGKVAFRFWFDEYDILKGMTLGGVFQHYNTYKYNDILYKLCLTYDEVDNYGKGKDLYAWHIKKLEIFDEPKELSDFEVRKLLTEELRWHGDFRYYTEPLKKAPQKFCYCYVVEGRIINELHRKDK